MKNVFKILLVCICIVTSAITAKADYDFSVNNAYYKIKSLEERTCIFTNKEEHSFYYNLNPDYSGEVIIPSKVNYNGTSFTVTEIGYGAFANSNITSVTMPSTIELIGQQAFYQCKYLKEVKFSDGLKTIAEKAFSGCLSLRSIKFPQQLSSIGNWAFEDCPIHGSLTFPKSCSLIGGGAFAGTRINTVTLPERDGLIGVGTNCFNSVDSIYIGTSIFNPIRNHDAAEIYHIHNITFGDNVNFMPGATEEYGEFKISKLTIGYNIGHVPELSIHIMRAIYIRNSTPPLADGFTDKTYVNAILYVPRGSKARYQKAHGWKKFVNIQEYDVHIPTNIQNRLQTTLVDGHECVKVGNVYWRTTNVGATSPYDLGDDMNKAVQMYDSITTWKKQGWRLPTTQELNDAFDDGYMIEGNKLKIYARSDYLLLVIDGNYNKCDKYYHSGNIDGIWGKYGACYARLVMDGATYQKRKAEQRQKEEQQRQKEENARYESRSNEIKKYVDTKSAKYSLVATKMQYEFALEDISPKKGKTNKHVLVLTYDIKDGKIFMSAQNGDVDELTSLFANMKLEGDAQKWKSGYYTINPSSSADNIAKEINRILSGMSVAQQKYNEPIIRQRKEKEAKQANINRLRFTSIQLMRLLERPCGINSVSWDKSTIKKSLIEVNPKLVVKNNAIMGVFCSEGMEIDKDVRMYASYVRIELKPKGKYLSVQYNIKVFKDYKECTDSEDEVFATVVNNLNEICKDYWKCPKISDSSYGEMQLENGVKLDNLRIISWGNYISLCFDILK